MTDQTITVAGPAGQAPPPTIEARIADLEARVTKLETPKPGGAPAIPVQHPSKGRVVIYRDPIGHEYAAIVTAVRDDGAISVVAFSDDAAPGITTGLFQVDPTKEKQVGWFWPPRT